MREFLGEQSENVYENKGSVQKLNHPFPLLIQGGEFELPSSDEEGWGVMGGKVFGEQSENVDENKGQGQYVANPTPLLVSLSTARQTATTAS